VNLNNGHLSPISQTPTEAVPRAFSIDLRGTFLYAAGLETGKLASYRIDQESGELEPNDVYDVGKGPMWVLMVEF
jgi:6-phosphogluconolactonase